MRIRLYWGFFSLTGFNRSLLPAESEPLERLTVPHVVRNGIRGAAERGSPGLQDGARAGFVLEGLGVA